MDDSQSDCFFRLLHTFPSSTASSESIKAFLPTVPKVNAALGEANEIIARSKAIGEGLQSISKSIRENRRGIDAVSLRVAEQYIEAFRNLAERSDSIIIPESGASGGNLSSLIAQAVTIASKLSETAKVETKPVKKNTSNADVDY